MAQRYGRWVRKLARSNIEITILRSTKMTGRKCLAAFKTVIVTHLYKKF